MRPKFRIKSRSVPNFSSKIYAKINSEPTSEQWRLFLQKQFELSPTIRELSKAEFDITSQNQNNFSVRQNFKIKKQIILLLEQENISEVLEQLQILKEKLAAIGQEKNVMQMIMYLECRDYVKDHLKNGGEEGVIDFVKAKVSLFLHDNQTLLAKIKTMTILSILLLRFHGILMSAEQLNMLIKTIDLKKKKMLQLDSKAERQMEFQCLLYLLLELYKILYLLKSDQQTIQHYYNQLHAYSEIFFSKRPTEYCLDLSDLRKILDCMRPVLNDLNLYEDSKVRQKLAFLHIKEEIAEKEDQKVYRKSIDLKNKQRLSIRSSKGEADSTRNLFKKKTLKLDSHRNGGKLKVVNQSQEAEQKLSTLEDLPPEAEEVNELTRQGIQLEFLLPLKGKVYVVHFLMEFRSGFSIIDFELTVRYSFFVEKFRLRGVNNCLESLGLIHISKFIEKVCFKLFGVEGQFSEIHNLIVRHEQIPACYTGIQSGLMRAKAVIKEYLRRHYQQEYLMGKKFIFPKWTVHAFNQSLQNQVKDLEETRLRAVFSKRKGIIHKDCPPPVLNETTYIKCMIRDEMSDNCFYFVFNAYFTHCFKGLDVHHFQNYEDAPDLSVFLARLKEISKTFYERHKLINKAKVVAQMLELQHREEQMRVTKKEFKVDEELQLTQQMKNVTTPLKVFNEMRAKSKRSELGQPFLEVIRTKANQYDLFVKKTEGKYIRFSNSKVIIHIPIKMASCSFKFEQKRLRMYNSIKIGSMTEEGMKNIKTSKKKNSIMTVQQEIVLLFSSHFVVRTGKGYSLVIEYSSPRSEYLYQVVASPAVRYFCLLKQKLGKVNSCSLDLQAKTIGGFSLDLYGGGRQPISEANHYYLTRPL